MSRALAWGTALTPLDLVPWKPHASAWNGKVQTLQPKGQLVAYPVGKVSATIVRAVVMCHHSARWNKEEAMERRKFLGALTGASLSVPLEGSSAERAGAQHPTASSARVARQSSFAPSQVEVAGNTVFVRRYGTGPAILLVHGFPRTSLIWRFLAPRLAENHTVICVDLRAYGRSGIPASTDNHFPYSKRAMA